MISLYLKLFITNAMHLLFIFQLGVKATFSRPATAAVIEETASELEDEDIPIDEVLITQIKEALADPVSF